MKDHGLVRVKKRRHDKGTDTEVVPRETRSYEVAHVHALWHFDFHEGKRQVITVAGERKTPYLFGLLDDCSRVCCHAQWYLHRENTNDLVHGLSQGIQKRGLPRSVLSDQGGPMKAAEILEGLERLSIAHYLTLPESPQQNGKQEHFWALVEGRLMPMLEGEPALTLELLNTGLPPAYLPRNTSTDSNELAATGNSSLMTAELKVTLADHSAGNYRVLMNLADELLTVAADRDLPRLDEKLFLDVFGPSCSSSSRC
jgi:transposase InsO family protein